jgi:hypothetical protein
MKKHFLILVLAAAILVSCSNEPRGNFNRADFNREWQLWLEQDIQNYSFSMNWGNLSGPHYVTLYIIDGVFTYVYVENDDIVPVPVEEKHYIPPLFAETISDIYAKIERVAGSAGRWDTVNIRYDSEWHYPEYFNCSGRRDFIRMIIDEFIVDPEIPLE